MPLLYSQHPIFTDVTTQQGSAAAQGVGSWEHAITSQEPAPEHPSRRESGMAARVGQVPRSAGTSMKCRQVQCQARKSTHRSGPMRMTMITAQWSPCGTTVTRPGWQGKARSHRVQRQAHLGLNSRPALLHHSSGKVWRPQSELKYNPQVCVLEWGIREARGEAGFFY